MIVLHLLGGVALRGVDTPAAQALLRQPKRLALLAYLALTSSEVFHRRDTLLALFWPESDRERANLSLRQALHVLRRALGEGVVARRGANELRLAEGAVRTDVAEMEWLLSAGQRAAAVELYSGPLLPGLHIPDAPEAERWLDGERDRLQRLAAGAAWALADEAERDGDGEACTRWALRALEVQPDDEGALRRAMATLARVGEAGTALRRYDRYERYLAAQGDTPGRATRALAEELRADAAEPVAPAATVVVEPTPAPPPLDGPAPVDAAALAGSPDAEPAGNDGRRSPPSATSPRRSWIRGRAGLLAAALLATVAGYAVLGEWRTAGAADVSTVPAVETVLVAPFVVYGGREWAYLGDGMVDLLGAKLDGAGRLRSADPDASLRMARQFASDSQGPRAGARRLRATWYVTGSVFFASGTVRLRATLSNAATGRAVARAEAEGAASELFGVVDRLATGLLQGQQSGPGSGLNRLASVTTASLPALKDYLYGEAALRDGRFTEAVNSFRRALQRDAAFALAEYRLSIAADFAGDNAAAKEHARGAAGYPERLGEQARRLVQAHAAQSRGDFPEAERIYREMLATNPDDVEAWYQLGDVQFHFGLPSGRSVTDAAYALEQVLVYDPAHPSALVHLARIEALLGRRRNLDALTRRSLLHYPQGDQAVEMLALRGASLGEGAAMDQALAGLRAASPLRVWVTAQRVAGVAWVPERAAPIFTLLADPGQPAEYRVRAFMALAELEIAHGRWVSARRHLASARALDSRTELLRRARLSALPLSPMPRAELPRLEAEIRGLLADRLQPLDPAVRPLWEHALETVRRRHRGHETDMRFIAAGEAVEFLGGVDALFLRAEVARREGRVAQAVAWYRLAAEDITGVPVNRAAAHLRQSELLRADGRRDAARRHDARARALWHAADPEARALLWPR
jgi:DNA-binding SARP family transcriptional activator/TolB-like protein